MCKVMLVERTAYDTVMKCHHSYHTRCHTSYVTGKHLWLDNQTQSTVYLKAQAPPRKSQPRLALLMIKKLTLLHDP